MADAVEQQDIRGLDIDKAVKGFSLTEYIFKKYCIVSTMSGDSLRWYQETAADLTATAPSKIANLSPLSGFPHLEVTWTRNTSYVQKFGAECFVSMEDIKSSDVDVRVRTLLRLTRAVVKQVDTKIWNTLTEDQSATNINAVTSTAAWNAGSGQDPVEDVLEALQDIAEQDYDIKNAVLAVNPKDYKSLVTWIITTKGSSMPEMASRLAGDNALTRFLGCDVVVSNNVTADYACVFIPQRAITWKSYTDTTAKEIEDPGKGSLFRVWEIGIPLLTDPKAVSLISNTAA